MSHRWMMAIVAIALIGMATVATAPAEAVEGRVSGYMFGDYYYVAANHNANLEDLNGFWFRRIYFTWDGALSERTSVRVRWEMGSPGDFSTSSKLVPFIKDAYLARKFDGGKIVFGLSPTPTWERIEHVWGYRSIEKTPADLHKLGSSRDFGVALKGAFGEETKVHYHLMVANGAGTKSETNKQKKALGSIAVTLPSGVIVEVYGDVDARPGKSDRYTGQAFVAWKRESVRVGAQYIHQERQNGDAPNMLFRIASAFVAGKVADDVNLFARYDRLIDPSAGGEGISYIPFSPMVDANFFVAGVDWSPEKNVHVMPNVEVVSYDDPSSGAGPDTDVIGRLTVFYKF